MFRRTACNPQGASARLLVILLLIVAACSPGQPIPSENYVPPTPSSRGPFVDTDPEHVILDVYWVDPSGQTPALPMPIQGDEPAAVLMSTSEPALLRIAVNGNGCPPETRLTVFGDPLRLELGITLSEAIPEPGLQCADVLTTHAFEVRLSTPVDLDEVVLATGAAIAP